MGIAENVKSGLGLAPLSSVAVLSYEEGNQTIQLKSYESIDGAGFLEFFRTYRGNSYEFLAAGRNGVQYVKFEKEDKLGKIDFRGLEHIPGIESLANFILLKNATDAIYLINHQESDLSSGCIACDVEHSAQIESIIKENPYIVKKKLDSKSSKQPKSLSGAKNVYSLKLTKMKPGFEECLYYAIYNKLPVRVGTDKSWNLNLNSVIQIPPSELSVQYVREKGQDKFTLKYSACLDSLFEVDAFEMEVLNKICSMLGKSLPTGIKIKEA